ncbi:MAG TPA: glycosyltransferase family 2 protein [Microbacteriaceae bacterium]|nr:glycosyltransferase family 2 protein [Microbacteriaceae bacterium]
MFQRSIGLVLVSIAVVGIGIVWWTLSATNAAGDAVPVDAELANGWHVLYSWQAPPLFAVIAAISVAFIVAAFFIGIEVRDITRSRRSHNIELKPLAPWVLMNETRGQFNGEVSVTVLVPAHNEEQLIAGAIESLHAQERVPDRIIVVADNCTDRTVDIARSYGVDIFESVDNRDKKAGALNQVMAEILPSMGPNDTVMIMDADTRLLPGYLSTAVRYFTNDRGLSAIGGLFYGEPGKGLLGQLQRNEYLRYSREIMRRGGRVFVLTGTSSIFRSQALTKVAESRGTLIPGAPGKVYDTEALTEDNELTIALKSLGALMLSPDGCQVETELMDTLPTLWTQRLRWQRGALENIAAYGVTATTSRYWSQQLGIAYSVFALWSFFVLITLQLLATDNWVWFPFWISMIGIFAAERVYTVWPGGWKARLLALAIIPELLYDSYIDLIFLKGVLDIAFKRDARWGHETREAVTVA